MTKTKVKVVGITRGVSKKGSAYIMLHVNKPMTEKQIENGSVGTMATSYFVEDGLVPKVTNDMVGKDIVISTLYAGNRDNLCDING